MDIMNELPVKKYEAADDLLAFISIYDDKNRTKAYKKMLLENKNWIKGVVCAEAGCGMGIMSEYMAQLGAKKVYAIEKNPYMFKIASERLKKYKNIKVLNEDILQFKPSEKIDLLLHEFYGQLLYDEELYTLNQLKFKPGRIIPDGGILKCGVMEVAAMEDEVIDRKVLQNLEGVLVSGMFDEKNIPLQENVASFQVGKPFKLKTNHQLQTKKGDLLYFGISITDQGKEICQSGICSNWSYVWTFRAGTKFSFQFKRGERAPEVVFKWLD